MPTVAEGELQAAIGQAVDRFGDSVVDDLHADITRNLEPGGTEHDVEMPHHGFAAYHQGYLAAELLQNARHFTAM